VENFSSILCEVPTNKQIIAHLWRNAVAYGAEGFRAVSVGPARNYRGKFFEYVFSEHYQVLHIDYAIASRHRTYVAQFVVCAPVREHSITEWERLSSGGSVGRMFVIH